MPTIHQTMGASSVKPLSTQPKAARATKKEAVEKEANVDKNMINSPEKILSGSDEAAKLVSSVSVSVLNDPLNASASHTADYRLMDVMRS